MAKINEKKSEKKQTNKNKTKQLDLRKLFEKFQIKDCKVVLNETFSHNIRIKIDRDTLIMKKKTIETRGKKTNNLVFNPKLNELISEQCHRIEPKKIQTLASQANEMWQKLKRQHKEKKQPDVDEFVLAKMKSYAPWPAKIQSFSKNGKKAKVYFYGTNNSGGVDIMEIVHFEDAADVIRLLLLRKIPMYSRAVVEVERCCGIPEELSLLKEFAAIEK